MSRSEVTAPVTIVSVTPVPLGRDSRTLRQGMSLARHGYRSVCVAKNRGWELNANWLPDLTVDYQVGESRRGFLKLIWDWVRRSKMPALLQLPFFLVWTGVFAYRHIWQVAWRLPAASLYCLHEFSSFLPVWLAARARNAPIIYDAHDSYLNIEKTAELCTFDRRFLVPFQRRLERACVASATSVLTVSDGVANLLSEQYGATGVVIRNCHDARLDAKVSTSLRDRLGLNQKDFLLVTVGNCKKGQNMTSAFEALSLLPENVHLALLGDGYEIVSAAIASRGLQSRVHLVGFVPIKEVVSSIRGADASLIVYYPRSANYRAALPNGLFQSIAAELPILYPALPEIEALMGKSGTGICIDPCDQATVVGAVRRLIEDPNSAGTLDMRKQLSRRYTWEAEERRFLHEIRVALGNPCVGPCRVPS